eukprot:scaffold8147_cov29-Cyclotella_meneghiniana.AAC.2
MNDLISNAKRKVEYKDWELSTVYDFGALSTREQAVLFNSYDVLVMVHGAQMANNIFALPGTFFIEVGCEIPGFLGEESYLSIIEAAYAKVEDCQTSDEGAVCLECGRPVDDRNDGDTLFDNFTMSQAKFDLMLNDIHEYWPHLLQHRNMTVE